MGRRTVPIMPMDHIDVLGESGCALEVRPNDLPVDTSQGIDVQLKEAAFSAISKLLEIIRLPANPQNPKFVKEQRQAACDILDRAGFPRLEKQFVQSQNLTLTAEDLAKLSATECIDVGELEP